MSFILDQSHKLYKYVFTVYKMFYRGSAGICRNGEQASRQSSKNKEGSSWDSAAQDGTSSRILHLWTQRLLVSPCKPIRSVGWPPWHCRPFPDAHCSKRSPQREEKGRDKDNRKRIWKAGRIMTDPHWMMGLPLISQVAANHFKSALLMPKTQQLAEGLPAFTPTHLVLCQRRGLLARPTFKRISSLYCFFFLNIHYLSNLPEFLDAD